MAGLNLRAYGLSGVCRLKSNMAPLVTIGVPVYNGERFLAEALRSILAQDFRDFEVIVSDNGSTDATPDICRQYAAADNRIQFHRFQQNRGAAENYNYVIRAARGQFFKLAAHDDLLAPSFLSRCVEAFQEAPSDVVLVYPRTTMIDESGARLRDYDDRLDVRYRRPSRRFRHVMRHVREPNALFGLIRTGALLRTGLMGKGFASDWVLLEELSLQGQFREIPERLFFRRVHPQMCCKVYRTPAEQAVWFDPANAAVHQLPWCRLFLSRVRAVRRAQLPLQERALCYGVLLEELVRRSGKRMARELLRLS